MNIYFSSTLLLTLLLAVGLIFFLRAASKDRTTVVQVQSALPPLEVLSGLTKWLENRGWLLDGGNAERKVLCFRGNVEASSLLATFLSLLGGLGAGSLGLVIRQLYPALGWWPLLIVVFGPLAGLIYKRRANREEIVELRLISDADSKKSILRVRAHRDELIAMELELANRLDLSSDGSLLSSPI